MISVEHLHKQYGNFTAIKDLSFEIEEGHVYGFLGPNGAGKSTTMNIITGCLSATSGHILVDGHDIFEEPMEAKRHIGYLPEIPPLYMSETPVEYLRFVAEAKGIKGAEVKRQIDDVIAQTQLEEMRNRRIAALSKGYKQRVGIAQALLGNPQVIILDEPTVGLDPIQIQEIRALIKKLGETHTVIFSSHILQEVQAICDRIVMIAKGDLIAEGSPEELETRFVKNSEIHLLADAAEKEVLNILAPITSIDSAEVTASDNKTIGDSSTGLTRARITSAGADIYEVSRAVFKAFAASGKDLLELDVKKATLEDVFLQLAGKPSEDEAEAQEENEESEVEEA